MRTVNYQGDKCFISLFYIYASNEPKSVLARDLGACRDNLRNSRSMFLIVEELSEYLGKKVILYFYLIQSARLLKLMMSGRKRKTTEKYPWVWSEQHILLTNME